MELTRLSPAFRLFLVLLFTIVCFMTLLLSRDILPTTTTSIAIPQPKIISSAKTELFVQSMLNASRQSILDCLTNGKWNDAYHTRSQEEELKIFLRKTRDQYGLPNPLQRGDHRCGNINFGGNLNWFRAICDPYGPTPCCFQNYCSNSSTENCTCDECYDLRQRLDAELSEWRNANPRCQVKQFKRDEACAILDNREIVFIGDSHMRHMFMGLQIILTGNEVNGSMQDNLPEDIRSQCLGIYMFTEKVCRKHIQSDHTLCDGKVRIRLAGSYATAYAPDIIKPVSEMVGRNNSMLLIGLGHHDSFNSRKIISRVTTPILRLLEGSGDNWPKLLWVGVHSLGLLKTPTVHSQQNPHVITFNKDMRAYLQSNNVAFMDSFNLTEGVASPDGSHYGKGANVLKAQVFLNYLNAVRQQKLRL